MLALIPDARAPGAGQQTVVERLLSITGEDSLTIDRKNKDPVTLTLRSRILLLSNEELQLGDASGALTSRMILLVTTKSFYGIEDVSLESKLLAELTGIFNWCLTGRARLYQRGYFVEPKASRDMKVQIDNLNSPINLFLNDCTEPEPHSYVTKGDLYEAYRIWCGDQGLKPQTQPVFGKMLRAARPEMIDHRVQENSVRKPIYWHKTRGLHGSLCHFSVFRGEVVIFSSVFLVTSSVWPSSGVAVAQENYGCYATFKPNTVLYLKISYIAFF